jgi:hypothetical protein
MHVLAPPISFFNAQSGNSVVLQTRMDAAISDFRALEGAVDSAIGSILGEISNLYGNQLLINQSIVGLTRGLEGVNVNLANLRVMVNQIAETQQEIIGNLTADDSLFAGLGNMEMPLKMLAGAGAIVAGVATFGAGVSAGSTAFSAMGKASQTMVTMNRVFNTAMENVLRGSYKMSSGDKTGAIDIAFATYEVVKVVVNIGKQSYDTPVSRDAVNGELLGALDRLQSSQVEDTAIRERHQLLSQNVLFKDTFESIEEALNGLNGVNRLLR